MGHVHPCSIATFVYWRVGDFRLRFILFFFDVLQRAIFLDKTSLDMKNCDPPWELEASYGGCTCTVLAVYPAIQM